MERRKPLVRKTPLKAVGDTLKRTGRLRPVSDKQRRKKAAEAAVRSVEGIKFKKAIYGKSCIVCGRTEAASYVESGYGHQAHHGIPKSRLKKLGLAALLWAPDNALTVCEEPCHRRHTLRIERIARAALPTYFLDWCWRTGLEDELAREYPA